jgi:hypothetical protein
MRNEIQSWRFLYTKHSSVKQSVTKTGALKEGRNSKCSFIVTDGKDYAECLMIAVQQCKFNENQLIGARRVNY